jgi:hypothetical protein
MRAVTFIRHASEHERRRGPDSISRTSVPAPTTRRGSRSPFGLVVSLIARPHSGPPWREALLPAPVVSGRFVVRATHERGVGVPSESELDDGIS